MLFCKHNSALVQAAATGGESHSVYLFLIPNRQMLWLFCLRETIAEQDAVDGFL